MANLISQSKGVPDRAGLADGQNTAAMGRWKITKAAIEVHKQTLVVTLKRRILGECQCDETVMVTWRSCGSGIEELHDICID